MGILEEKVKKRKKRADIKALLFSTIATAGLVGVAVVAPNVIGAMAKLGMLPGKRQKEIVNRARDRLLKQGLLERDGDFLRLSAKGGRAWRLFEAGNYSIGRPKRWDRKWRLIIFDIPEERRFLRVRLRELLQAMGFYRLQDSVWAYPYDCEDAVALLKADLKVGKDVLYIVVEEMEGSRRLLEYFKLH